MPKLISFYIRHCAIGFAIAAVFVAALIAMDVAHLRHLVTHTDAGPFALLILWVLNGIVFAGVQFGIAVMRLGVDEGDRDDPGQGGQMVPVRVAASSRAKTRRRV